MPSFGKSITRTMVDMQEPLKEMTGIDIGELLKSYAVKEPGKKTRPSLETPSRHQEVEDSLNDGEAEDQQS